MLLPPISINKLNMQEYKNIIQSIASNIHTGLIDFDEPRTKASIPTQASSEFITNKQQGDWAEDVILRAVNNNSEEVVAVKYGKSDDKVAGDEGFEDFFHNYQEELDTIGKRPDILLFKKEDFDESMGYDISMQDSLLITDYVKKAIAGIEVRSSAFLIGKYMEETNKTITGAINAAIEIRNTILAGYKDILQEKRPELINILEQLNETSIRSVSFKVPAWSSSERLCELRNLLTDLKSQIKTVQKRNSLSITPKVEDLKVVHKWIMTYNVPHFYVQVFFDKIYGMPFKHILELISNPSLEDEEYFIEQDTKNQNKTTIKIPSQNGVCLAEAVTEPEHQSVRKELRKGRLLFYVKFNGGEAFLDKEKFENLFNCKL